MHLSLLALLASSLSIVSSSLIGADWDTRDYYAVEVAPGKSVEDIASRLGLRVHGALGALENHYLLEAPKADDDVISSAVTDLKLKRRKRSQGWDQEDVLDHVRFNQKQLRRKRLHKRAVPRDPAERRAAQSSPPTSSNVQKGLDIAKSLGIADPIFKDQWHLYNPSEIGNDINVTGVWQQGITGKGAISCIIDDGLDFDSDDLSPNYFAAGSWDYNNPGPDPKPRLDDDRHGTRCAGEIAAAKNDVCGVGVAYDSKVSGVRILSAVISDADEALALNYKMEENQIYSCSWGPPDDGRSMEAPGILIRKAMLTGIQKGRKGLGSLFVFAIGNGASNDDDCNFDGYTNSIYSVSVGGIDRKGLHPYYSEKCSAQLVVTYSSGSGDAIHTTEVGKNDCYVRHGGTSAAGPLVAGIYALVLEARPDLHWRDFQYITMLTAIPLDEAGGQWQDTPMGKRFSHQYGYGKIDAYRVIELAKNWTSVKPQAWYWSPWLHVRHDIPQGQEGLASHFDVTREMLQEANLERIEHVTVTMNVAHTRRGDLSVELRSPSGIVSHIATPRRNDEAASGYVDWTFMSVAHWGESGIGTWTVVVKDTNENNHKGSFTDWRLRLWGESIDGEKQELLPLPSEHDDDDHDTETTSAIVSTTTHGDTHPTGAPEGNPTDHPDRPVNAKPTSVTPIPSSSAPAATATPVEGVPVPDPESESGKGKNPNLLPTPFPTFGVSKKTQVWIYGAIVLIAIFCISLAAWYFIVRRRNNRNARDVYEFEMLDEDEADDDDARGGLMSGGGFGNGNARKKRRAGELYDAFAEGSEEEDVFSVGDEEDDERYRDEDEESTSDNAEKTER
ncbi:Protease KEX1 [Sphaceloma murrayae]|uniref:Protease KEX1 n=1 Tax=Sphaceloma murrayae TaxID=2082308 RepID=A0A2K1QT15_9PEZI|nr:Protease KEX1 [Sphaceloma murrayae]